MQLFPAALAMMVCLATTSIPALAAECGPLQRVTTLDTKSDGNGMMFVPVKIGSADRLMLLDTGGAVVGIAPEAVKEFSLATGPMNVRYIGATGRTSDRYATIPSLGLGPIALQNVRALVFPGEFNSRIGVIGAIVPSGL